MPYATAETATKGMLTVEEARAMYPDYDKYEAQLKQLGARAARGEILFPRKHLAALKTLCLDALLKARRDSPQTPLSVALADAIRPINPHTTPEMLLELTRHLIKEWMKMEAAEKPGTATEPTPKASRKKTLTAHN
ncbi:MAG: hypothetical protein ACK4Q5_02465 [Saprospiraceae bacterium]